MALDNPHQKRKKPSLSSFLPALQGERCARAAPLGFLRKNLLCVEREPFLEYTGFSFHDFADSQVMIPLGLVTPSPTHKLGMTRVES